MLAGQNVGVIEIVGIERREKEEVYKIVELVKSQKRLMIVIPAKVPLSAGFFQRLRSSLDTGFHR
jgi:hypothetical protein